MKLIPNILWYFVWIIWSIKRLTIYSFFPQQNNFFLLFPLANLFFCVSFIYSPIACASTAFINRVFVQLTDVNDMLAVLVEFIYNSIESILAYKPIAIDQFINQEVHWLNWIKLYLFYNDTIDKQVLQLILISLVGTDVGHQYFNYYEQIPKQHIFKKWQFTKIGLF